jgi:uncharacterized protein (DUF302 family)
MADSEPGVVSKSSSRSVAETAARLVEMIEAKGLRLFAVIDQGEEARRSGMTLRDTVLILFGSPAAGTPIMVASPLAALDLPLKILVWADGQDTKVTYYAPSTLVERHHIDPTLATNLAGIDALTDALVAD